jgi:hypothetical protein
MTRAKKPLAGGDPAPTNLPKTPPEATAEEAPAATPKAADDKAEPAKEPPPPAPKTRTLGALIHENTQFLSSVVIGGAGLIATSLYQCNNSRLAERQAEWQQSREDEKSKNDWRIERAKILAQNLQTLTTRGSDTVEQRYGVLLSLTRGKIIERDLAVSYALELGKDSADDMRSVLANIDEKDASYYKRLADAYVPTCVQRYGVTAASMYVCRQDAMAAFSQGIAGAMADDLNGATEQALSAPLGILTDERYVQTKLLSLLGLYGEFITDAYEHRQWPLLERFLNSSKGAGLVAYLDLLMEPVDQANSADQIAIRQRFDVGLAWLKDYMVSPSCDSECRGRILPGILSHLGHSPGYLDRLLRELLEGQRSEMAALVSRLQARLVYCQIDPLQMPALRDQILVPALLAQVDKPQPDLQLLDELIGLLEPMPLPPDTSADWKRLKDKLTLLTSGLQPKRFLNAWSEQQRRLKTLAKLPAPPKPKPTPPPAAATPPRSATASPAGAAAVSAPASVIGNSTANATSNLAQLIRGSNFCAVVSQPQTPSDDHDE